MDGSEEGDAHDPLLIPGPERQAAIARMVFEVLDAGVVVQGPRGRIATANPAAASLFGVTPDAMFEVGLGDLPGVLIRPDGSVLPSEEYPHQLAVDTGEPQTDVLIGLSGVGESVRWIEVSARPLSWNGIVFAVVSSIRDVTPRQLAQEALAHQATHDLVTGLPNRRVLMDHLELALSRAGERGGQVAVLFYDVDQFRLINDSLGHPVGDAMLEQLGARFRAVAGASDTVVRFGGDEFVIVREGVEDVEDALALAQRLSASLEEPLLVDRAQRMVTASVGVALSQPGDTPSSLLSDADAALNLAKEKGRARIEVFSDDLRREATRRFDLDTALRVALARGELRLVYQPIVAVGDGTPIGCEALLRWGSAEHGPVVPVEFIPIADRSGLIVPIGAWVISEATRQMATWRRAGLVPEDLWVAVNIAARQLGDSDLAAVVTEALDGTGLEAGHLHLEMTEGTILDDIATSVERLDELKSLGVRLDIDDFGTGYSSLSYLKRLPIHGLKIDRSFTAGLGTDPYDTSIVHAVISLGHALDLEVVAEGVEHASQLEELRLLGCDLAQGYHWCTPLEPAEFVDWIATQRPTTS